MLFTFFLKRLFITFALIASCLVLIFSTAHFFVRLSTVNVIMLIPIVFGIMLPMVLQYVVPIASGATVYMVVGDMSQRQETLMLYFLRKSQWALAKAVMFFSVFMAIFYGFLIFTWVPKSYAHGKEALMKLAQQQFLHYEPNFVHEPMPGLYLIFQNKSLLSSSKVQLENLFLSFKNKQETYFFTAQHGILTDTVFVLNNGSLLYQSGKDHYYSSFTQTSFDLKQLMQTYEKKEQHKLPLKYLSWEPLITSGLGSQLLGLELHKRFAQVLWQLLVPIIILLGAFFLKKRKSVLLESFFLSGLLFLMMYIFLTLGQVVGGLGALVFFYLPPILITCFCLCRYQHCS